MKIQWPPFSWLPTIALQMVPRSKIHISDHLLDTYCHRLCYSHLKTQYVQTKVTFFPKLLIVSTSPSWLKTLNPRRCLPSSGPSLPTQSPSNHSLLFPGCFTLPLQNGEGTSDSSRQTSGGVMALVLRDNTSQRRSWNRGPSAQNPAHCSCLPCFLSEGLSGSYSNTCNPSS